MHLHQVSVVVTAESQKENALVSDSSKRVKEAVEKILDVFNLTTKQVRWEKYSNLFLNS